MMARRRRPWSLVVAGIAALLAGLAWWLWIDGPNAGVGGIDGPAGEPPPPAHFDLEPPPPPRPEDRTPEPKPGLPAGAEVEFELQVLHLDRFGLPEALRQFPFGPADGTVHAYGNGYDFAAPHELRFRWPAGPATAELVVDDGHLRRLSLRPGEPLRIVYDGAEIGAVTHGERAPLRFDQERSAGNFGTRLCRDVPFQMAREPRGIFWPRMGRPGLRPPEPEERGVLAGRVLHPDGRLANGFKVRLVARSLQALTPQPGHYEFVPLPYGIYDLWAADEDGNATAARATIDGPRITLDLPLARRPQLRGTVTDLSGQPLLDARLVWCTAAGDFRNHAVTADDGRFLVVADVPAQGQLWACWPNLGVGWPAVGGPAATDGPELRLAVDTERCRGKLRAALRDFAGLAAEDFSVRLWHEASGLGRSLSHVGSEDGTLVFGADGMPTGSYRAELVAPRFGAVPIGRWQHDGQQTLEVELAPPPLCAVTLVASNPEHGADQREVVRTSGLLPMRLSGEFEFGAQHLLGPGNYELRWQGSDDRVHRRAFAVAPGQSTLRLSVP